MGYRLRPAARSDLALATRPIAERNPDASLRWAARMIDLFARLGEMPGMGAPRFEVLPGLRLLPFKGYNILYVQDAGGVAILRVVHGARAWERLLP